MQIGTRVTGSSFAEEDFVLHVREKTIDPVVFRNILRNQAVGLLVTGVLSESESARIDANFRASETYVRADQVAAVQIGPNHFGAEPEAYFRDVAASRQAVRALFDGTAVLERLRAEIARCIPGKTFRQARHGGRSFGDARAVRWANAGKYALALHDDRRQLDLPAQRGFEIQDVDVPVAVNLYPRCPAGSGALRIYNVQPSAECAREFGLEFTGYPYPDEAVAGIRYIDVPIRSNDLLILNGRFVHGVLGGPEVAQTRLLVSFFVGATDDSTVVSWT